MADGAALKERGNEGRLFTYADYKNWNPAEIGRYELIYGIAYAMARPNARHQSMLMELLKQIAVYLTGKP
ncbi:MAG: Uma2 family endonuclease, partial [Treponema sp.]|nr:Uma2 family endonuclease [Treponema sp.]